MLRSNFRSGLVRRFHVTAVLIGIVAPCALLAGCGGGGSGTVVAPSVYAAKTVSATKMPFGALTGDLQVTTAAKGSTATGTLTLADPTRAIAAHSHLNAAAHSRLIVATPNLNGTYDPKTGAINLTGTYEYPAGTKHTVTVTGNLPVPPSGKGSLTFVVDGTTYGPYVFGDNTPASTGSTGTTPPTGTTGTTSQSSLVISAASGTKKLQNGPFPGVMSAEKYVGNFTLNGVQYTGQYNADVKSDLGNIGFDLFGLDVTAGQSFDVATSPRPFINGYEGGDAYLADTGTLTVTAISDTSITFNFKAVHFKPAPESTLPSTNQFTVDGSFTAPLTIAKP